MPPRPYMLQGEAQMGVLGKGMPRCVFRRVCALCSMILTVPSVPRVQAGGVCVPTTPSPSPPGDLSRAGHGGSGCQHRDSPVARCLAVLPGVTNPQVQRQGVVRCPPDLSLDGQILPARVQRTKRRPWPRMAVPWGAGAGAPLGRLRRRGLGLAPAGTGQLSPATVSCSQQPRGAEGDG